VLEDLAYVFFGGEFGTEDMEGSEVFEVLCNVVEGF
jgi:hypothetical protein